MARVEAAKPASLTAEQKQLKIAAATAQMALKKARKQLASNPDSDELKAQIPELEQACEETQRAYDQALGETSVKTTPPPAAGADDDTKRLKIEAAMIRASLKKAERAAGDAPTEEQEKEINALREQVAAAEARLPKDEAPKKPVAGMPANENMKKAKLDAAMAKAELKKAERALAETPDDSTLQEKVEGARVNLTEALKAVEQAEASSTLPPPARERVDKKPVDDTTRQLKTDMAMAKAAFKKAERALQDEPGNGQLETDLAEAKQALDAAAKAFADHMASKETD